MSEHSFDPEVVALLQNIAADPRSSLLHVPKERLLKWVGRPDETISPHGSYLSKAEKHLVTAYREQAAWVLLEACILRLKEDPQIYSTLNPDPKTLRTIAQRVSGRIANEERPFDALRAVAEGTEVSISSLAAASMRLLPSELATNLLALAHQQEGHVRASMRVLAKLFDGASSFHHRAQAWENMARAHVMQQVFMEAFKCNYQASVVDERKVRFVVWCLTSAIQAGEETKAIESASRLDKHPQTGDLTLLVQGLRLGKTNGSWSPTRASLRLLPRIRSHMSEKSGAICDTFS